VVLHGDAGPAAETLEQMAVPGARRMTHYYVAANGEIHQLLDDEYAAFHSGLAVWAGARRNINRISIGVTLERSHDGYTADSLHALAWLLETLRVRYGIPATGVVRWGELLPAASADLADLPTEQFRPQET
jgi:N-acetylmuramoyl-L-alanine amidase